jgi:CheY-like chemotaxis protein
MNKGKPEIDLKDYESILARFDSLMQYRVKDILLVASLYDSFILEEDGQLAHFIFSESVEFNLTYAPHIKRVSTGEEAINALKTRNFDLIIVIRELNDLNLTAFCHQAREIIPHIPITFLAFHSQDLSLLKKAGAGAAVDRCFLWNGDIKILPTIVKYVEDRMNVERDTRLVGVRVIILIEDSVRFYSSYLPLIYTEITAQTNALMADGINPADRLLRMRARPKILLADSFEEGWNLFDKYRDYILGIISDIRYAKNGQVEELAGLQFARMVKKEVPDLPVLLQSSNRELEPLASAQNLSFLYKESPTLLTDLRDFIMRNFGFGDFIFRLPNGAEIARASDFHSMEKCLADVDDRSLIYHANHNHFSNWLMARTEFDLAIRLRPRKVSEFKNPDALRRYLLDAFRIFRRKGQVGLVADFSPRQFERQSQFVRIGDGSLGGKGRGLAFINNLLDRYNISDSFPEVKIFVPPAAIIGTAVFDRFLEENNLLKFALESHSDEEISARFAAGKLPDKITADLEAYLEVADYPLAVRSSSLLEDSHYQPFAGIYETHMLPNCHPELKERRERLEAAIKYIYACVFFRNAKNYIEATGNRVEEEKMAVVIQKAAGARRGNYFYPVISGVARSYNYYPIGHIKSEEGVAYVALGLGKTIVEGGNCLYFSPKNPHSLPQFTDAQSFLKNSQREFFAIDLSNSSAFPSPGGNSSLIKLGLEQSETDGSIAFVASTYSSDDDRVHGGISRAGIRVVTFAPILKSRIFPLDDIIRFLLQLGSTAMNCPIEMEFAAELEDPEERGNQFHFLQIRPMTRGADINNISLDNIDPQKIICRSEQSLSNGRITTIRDIIYVIPDKFDRARMREMAGQVERFNEKFRDSDKPYLLIGPGRWGTSDRWLGVPVTWNQISAARVIVEAAYGDFAVTPSFGTHFFQNLISSHIGYLTVDNPDLKNFIDWEWLAGQRIAGETEYIRHLTLETPIEILIDGRLGRAVILKPTQ